MAKKRTFDPEIPARTKDYKLVDGECKDCTLYSNCLHNRDSIRHFLLTNGILCEHGKRLDAIERK